MTPPRDQQSVEEIALACEKLISGTQATRLETRRFIVQAINAAFTAQGTRKAKDVVKQIVDTCVGVGVFIPEGKVEAIINAALTAHDEALTGEWAVVPVDTSQPTGMCFIRTREGGKLRFYLRYEQAVAVAAAHNSALRPLVDALRKRFNDHILTCPDCSGPDEGCEEGQWLEQMLQPYSGQKDGKC